MGELFAIQQDLEECSPGITELGYELLREDINAFEAAYINIEQWLATGKLEEYRNTHPLHSALYFLLHEPDVGLTEDQFRQLEAVRWKHAKMDAKKQKLEELICKWKVTKYQALIQYYGGGSLPPDPALLVDSFLQCAENNATLYLLSWLDEHKGVSQQGFKVTWYSASKKKGQVKHKPLYSVCSVYFKPWFEALVRKKLSVT